MVSFNFSFDPNVSYNQQLGFEVAGLLWSQYIADDTTVNIHVDAVDTLPDNVLGGAIPGIYADQSFDTVQERLATDQTSTADQQAVESLNQLGDTTFRALLETTQDNGDRISLTRANAKALGITDPSNTEQLDGYIVVNTLSEGDLQWGYEYTRSIPAFPGTVDFLSVALHEIGHVLGFTSGLDAVSNSFDQTSSEERQDRLSDTTILDLFRYSERSVSANALELGVGVESYFSVDGGQTSIAPFSTGQIDLGLGADGYQASHWKSGSDLLADSDVPETLDLGLNIGLGILVSFTSPGGTTTAIVPVDGSSPEPANALTSSGASIQVTNDPDRNPVGVMDPTLATGERTNISWVDLMAMDAIGYDLTPLGEVLVDAKINSSSELFTTLDQLQTADSSVQLFNVPTAELLNEPDPTLLGAQLIVTAVEANENIANPQIGRPSDEIALMVEQSELFERRRRRRRRSSSGFFQESDDFEAPDDDFDDDDFDDDDASPLTYFQGSIQGQVRLDLDQDGDLADADAGLEGVSVSLFSDFDKDGQEDGVAIATVITGEDGRYRFEDLAQGRYILVSEDLDGFVSTNDRNGNAPNRIAFINVFNEMITGQDFLDAPLTIVPNSAVLPNPLGQIQGQVRIDLDQDGDLNDLDIGLPGVEIQLFSDFDQDGREDGAAIATVVTNENGQYHFEDLVQGKYIVVADDLEGFVSTADRNGYDPNRIAFINVRNTSITGKDFLDTPLDSTPALAASQGQGRIQGQVRNDQDQDGDLNDLEGGLVGVGIQLFEDFDQDGREDGAAIATTQTNWQGEYVFDDLIQGQYIVVAEDLDGFLSTGDRNGYNPNRIAYLKLQSNDSLLTGQDFLDATTGTAEPS